jgi:hypothetical protein
MLYILWAPDYVSLADLDFQTRLRVPITWAMPIKARILAKYFLWNTQVL